MLNSNNTEISRPPTRGYVLQGVFEIPVRSGRKYTVWAPQVSSALTDKAN